MAASIVGESNESKNMDDSVDEKIDIENICACIGESRKDQKTAKESGESITFALSGLIVKQKLDNDININNLHITIAVHWHNCTKHKNCEKNIIKEFEQIMINHNDYSMKLKYQMKYLKNLNKNKREYREINRYIVTFNDPKLENDLRSLDKKYGCNETLTEMQFWQKIDANIGLPGHRVFHINPIGITSNEKNILNGKAIIPTRMYAKMLEKNVLNGNNL